MDKFLVLVNRNDMIRAIFTLLEIPIKKDEDLTLTKEQLSNVLKAIQNLKSSQNKK
jgi:hypothetical protein